MKLSDNIGNTPLIKISERIYAKAELLNPTGSIKDRMASNIINNAFNRGYISEGDTIVEATSGNAGISFAWLAAERGLKCVIVMPSNMSDERKKMLKFYGAELIEVDPGDFDGAIRLRDQLSVENGWFNTNQFHNELNIEAHFNGTAVEIIKDMAGKKISALVSGTGTGGTLMGCQKRLKGLHTQMDVVAVEPDESPVMSGGQPGLHGIQGIGDGSKFLVDLDFVDHIIRIKTEDAKQKAVTLSKELGIFVGISAGANILAAEEYVKNNNPDGFVVTFLCDRGERYLSCL
jgi:cysteine synthase A